MKIAFLSFYSGQVERGVEVGTAELAKRLAKTHEVTVFQAGEKISADVQTIRLPVMVNRQAVDTSSSALRKLYLDYWSRMVAAFTFRFLPYLVRNKYDVVIPANGGWQVVLVRIVTWLLGKKMLIQGNAGIGRDDLFGLFCFPDYYIAISPAGFIWASKFAPWIRKAYIPYGVDISLFKNIKSQVLSLPKPVVLCVAAFQKYKRIAYLIKAMQIVKNASLLIIGHGELEKQLQEMGERLLGKRFLLKTGIGHDELLKYYKSADIFSLPSKSSEAFGIVYIEAMAVGLPIIATDDINRREIIGEAGILVDPENEQKYAKAIELALKKDFHDIPQKQARRFAWENIVNQYEELIKSL